MLAAGCGNSALVSRFLANGADLSLTDAQGLTSLHFAAATGDFETRRLLVARGADVNALSKFGDTALMAASAAGTLESVRLLIAKGARVNLARTVYAKVRAGQVALVGLTALIQAAPYAPPAVVQALLEAGADPNARDSREMTALMFAVASDRQNPDAVRLLLKARAAVDAKSNTGETALDWAMKFGNPEVPALLPNRAAALRRLAPPSRFLRLRAVLQLHHQQRGHPPIAKGMLHMPHRRQSMLLLKMARPPRSASYRPLSAPVHGVFPVTDNLRFGT